MYQYLLINRLIGKGCKLVGCGSALPDLQFSNDDIAKIVDTSDEWISSRTGIHNRRILSGIVFRGRILLDYRLSWFVYL